MTSLDALERFHAKTDKAGSCWNWTAYKNERGYARFTLNGKRIFAHRFAYETFVGPIPDGYDIDHTCYNRGCVNPAHLRAVTHKQNSENRTGAQRNSSSGVRGVSWVAKRKKWLAQVIHHRKSYRGGHFNTIEEAEIAVIELRNKLFTHNELDRVA